MLKRRSALLVLICSSLLLTGCSGVEDPAQGKELSGDDGSVVIPTIPPFEPAQIWTVPENIDSAYVQRVVSELEWAYVDVMVETYRTGEFSELSERKLNDTYAEPLLGQVVRRLKDGSKRNLDIFADEPGPPVVTINNLRTARADCISAKVEVDFSPVFAFDVPAAESSIVLKRVENPLPWNRTRWKMAEVPVDGACE